MKGNEWVFPALFLALLSVGYGLVPLPRGRTGADSFGIDGGGKKAFYDFTTRLLPEVHRSSQDLIPADPNADVIVLLGPERYPDRAQWQTLHDWVSQGNSLLFAARWQDPAVDLGPFEVEIVPSMEREVDEGPAVENELSSGEIDWRSSGEVRFQNPEASVDVSYEGLPQVVWLPVGEGILVVVASDFVFSNLSLTKADNGVLAFRILESTYPAGPVYFDEGLNEAGAPRVVGVLFEPPFRLAVVQLLGATLLFAWMASRRFGPIETRGRVERRSLVEHAEALGILHYRARTGSRLVASYLEHFRSELGLAYRKGARGAVLEPSSGSTGPGADILTRALRAMKSPDLERERVAPMIISLARLRQGRVGTKGN